MVLHIFETEKLGSKLKDTAEIEGHGITVQSEQFGKIQIKANSATVSGVHFLSDTYIVQATTDDSGAQHQAFVKVNTLKRHKGKLYSLLSFLC